MRRSVLAAALRGDGLPPTDEDLSAALDDLLSSGAALTRLLLGGQGDDAADDEGERMHDDGSYDAC